MASMHETRPSVIKLPAYCRVFSVESLVFVLFVVIWSTQDVYIVFKLKCYSLFVQLDSIRISLESFYIQRCIRKSVCLTFIIEQNVLRATRSSQSDKCRSAHDTWSSKRIFFLFG